VDSANKTILRYMMEAMAVKALSEDRISGGISGSTLSSPAARCRDVNLVSPCSPSQPEMSAFGLPDGVGNSPTDSEQSDYKA
jgi:hypothetical protein